MYKAHTVISNNCLWKSPLWPGHHRPKSRPRNQPGRAKSFHLAHTASFLLISPQRRPFLHGASYSLFRSAFSCLTCRTEHTADGTMACCSANLGDGSQWIHNRGHATGSEFQCERSLYSGMEDRGYDVELISIPASCASAITTLWYPGWLPVSKIGLDVASIDLIWTAGFLLSYRRRGCLKEYLYRISIAAVGALAVQSQGHRRFRHCTFCFAQ